MKRILFLTLAVSFYGSVNAQLFMQNFSSSTVVADYANASNPTSGQFSGLTNTNATIPPPVTVSIENEALKFDKINLVTINAFRNYAFSVKPTFVQFKMDIAISSWTAGTTTPLFSVYLGDSFTSSPTGISSLYKSRFGIVMQSPDSFKVGTIDNIGGAPTSTAIFSGNQTITFVVNNSGGDQTYTAPDATTETVVMGKMDVWVGTTRAINDFSLRTLTSTGGSAGDISGFKIVSPSTSGIGVFVLDNIEFKDLLGDSVLLSTSKFENSVADIKVYPNPTEGVFEIKNLPLSLETIKLGLYSLDSKLLQSKTYNVNNGTVKLDISGLAKGVYFVKGDSDSPLVAKVIKE